MKYTKLHVQFGTIFKNPVTYVRSYITSYCEMKDIMYVIATYILTAMSRRLIRKCNHVATNGNP